MANLNIFNQNSKDFDLKEDLLSSIKPYIPDIISEMKKSVECCSKVYEEYDPLDVSSWRASLTKGLIYKNFSTNPNLCVLLKDLTNNNFLLVLPRYKLIVCKADSYGLPIRSFSTNQAEQLFYECNQLLLTYSLDSDGKLQDIFIISTQEDNRFKISLVSEYKNEQKQAPKIQSVLRHKKDMNKKKKQI